MGLDSRFPRARDAQNPPVLRELERNPVSLFVTIWCRPFDSRFTGCSFRDDTLGASTRNVLTSLMTRKADSFGPFRAPPRARVAGSTTGRRPRGKWGVVEAHACEVPADSATVPKAMIARGSTTCRGLDGVRRSPGRHLPCYRRSLGGRRGPYGTGACRHRGLLHAGQFHEARGNSRGPGAAKGRRRAAFCFCDRGGGSLRPDRR